MKYPKKGGCGPNLASSLWFNLTRFKGPWSLSPPPPPRSYTGLLFSSFFFFFFFFFLPFPPIANNKARQNARSVSGPDVMKPTAAEKSLDPLASCGRARLQIAPRHLRGALSVRDVSVPELSTNEDGKVSLILPRLLILPCPNHYPDYRVLRATFVNAQTHVSERPRRAGLSKKKKTILGILCF